MLPVSRYKRTYPAVTEIQKWLVDNDFDLSDLGTQKLKDISGEISAYTIDTERPVESR